MAIKEFYSNPQVREKIEKEVLERRRIENKNSTLQDKIRSDASDKCWEKYRREYPQMFEKAEKLFYELRDLGVITLLEEFTEDKISVGTHESKGYFKVERPLFDSFSMDTPDEELEKVMEQVKKMTEEKAKVWNLVLDEPSFSIEGEWSEGLEIVLEETKVEGWPWRHTTGRYVPIYYFNITQGRDFPVGGEGNKILSIRKKRRRVYNKSFS